MLGWSCFTFMCVCGYVWDPRPSVRRVPCVPPPHPPPQHTHVNPPKIGAVSSALDLDAKCERIIAALPAPAALAGAFAYMHLLSKAIPKANFCSGAPACCAYTDTKHTHTSHDHTHHTQPRRLPAAGAGLRQGRGRAHGRRHRHLQPPRLQLQDPRGAFAVTEIECDFCMRLDFRGPPPGRADLTHARTPPNAHVHRPTNLPKPKNRPQRRTCTGRGRLRGRSSRPSPPPPRSSRGSSASSSTRCVHFCWGRSVIRPLTEPINTN